MANTSPFPYNAPGKAYNDFNTWLQNSGQYSGMSPTSFTSPTAFHAAWRGQFGSAPQKGIFPQDDKTGVYANLSNQGLAIPWMPTTSQDSTEGLAGHNPVAGDGSFGSYKPASTQRRGAYAENRAQAEALYAGKIAYAQQGLVEDMTRAGLSEAVLTASDADIQAEIEKNRVIERNIVQRKAAILAQSGVNPSITEMILNNDMNTIQGGKVQDPYTGEMVENTRPMDRGYNDPLAASLIQDPALADEYFKLSDAYLKSNSTELALFDIQAIRREEAKAEQTITGYMAIPPEVVTPETGAPTPHWLPEIAPGLTEGGVAKPSFAKTPSGQTLAKMTPSEIAGAQGYVDFSAGKVQGATASGEDWLSNAYRMMPQNTPKSVYSWNPY
jgi:hypothetical protein